MTERVQSGLDSNQYVTTRMALVFVSSVASDGKESGLKGTVVSDKRQATPVTWGVWR